ncbi:toll/interleukin-1 receptor-like protein isoform X3 [Pistacia vera]|uniref:toll/interleukin-1 receptor-like protein isoform X3 n=1 Tax=Pistacia vera TaxID=55513 RepID=UPI0012639A3E|nr:toll/interleukin-1 receptor-like protein isoform X3 [Pistacia vera]
MSSQRVSYDIFLNFQGKDTGKNFTDHLCANLVRKRFNVFKGEKELERGTPVSPEITKGAIEKSRISIVIFSKSYASSTRCLEELVRIVECMKTKGQVAIPIFYDVEPSVPRRQKGGFQEAFTKYEEMLEKTENVQMWRNALEEMANLSGFNLQEYRDESELIKAVVEEISCELSGQLPFINFKKLLAGVNSCLEKVQIQANTIKVQWRESTMAPPLMFPFFFFVRCFRITPNKGSLRSLQSRFNGVNPQWPHL